LVYLGDEKTTAAAELPFGFAEGGLSGGDNKKGRSKGLRVD
jgi:hypothetical protein